MEIIFAWIGVALTWVFILSPVFGSILFDEAGYWKSMAQMNLLVLLGAAFFAVLMAVIWSFSTVVESYRA